VPKATRKTVAIDLREDWPKALRDNGFQPDQPTAWIAEGLLIYLPPEAQDRLFDNITALSAPGSWLGTEFVGDFASLTDERHEKMRERIRALGSDVEMADLVYTGERNHVGDYLTPLGWHVSPQPIREAFAANGFTYPEDTLTPFPNLTYIGAALG
jgi:methyltransferase (TIGR00027 family)